MLKEILEYNKVIKNKYFYAYIRLAEKIIAENRVYNKNLHERHHILPRCFGGTYVLPYTFKEHFVAHLLLTKFTEGKDKSKMTFAIHTFFHFDRNRKLGIRTSSVFYEKFKQDFVNACSERSKGNNNSMADSKIYKWKHIMSGKIIKCTRLELLNKNTELTTHDINSLIRKYKDEKTCSTKGWAIYIDNLNKFSDEIPHKVPEKESLKKCMYCDIKTTGSNIKRWHNENCKHKN